MATYTEPPQNPDYPWVMVAIVPERPNAGLTETVHRIGGCSGRRSYTTRSGVYVAGWEVREGDHAETTGKHHCDTCLRIVGP